MKDTIKYVGLDVSKEKIAVAIADEGRDEAKVLGHDLKHSRSYYKVSKKAVEKR